MSEADDSRNRDLCMLFKVMHVTIRYLKIRGFKMSM